VEDWWCDQGSEVLNECLESDGAGLHEPDCVAPDINVLGSWMAGAFSKTVNAIEPIERAEMLYLSNHEWV
jgi:hypothetical protein